MALAITSTNLKTRDTVSDTGEYTHTSRDDLLRPSAVIQIHGTDFGATQGNSNVYIADGTTFASSTKVLQTPSSWSNTLIELTVDLGSFFESDKLYIFVAYEEGEVGEVISSAHWVTISEPDVHYDLGYFQLSPGIGDDFVIISEKQLGYVPKVVHMKFTASIENAYYYRADPIAFAEAFLVYDPATNSFDCITTEFYMTSYTAGVSKVYRTTDQFSFTHYLDNTAGTFQVSTFDVRYVDGVGIVLDHNSNTMEYGLTIGYSVYGGRTVKGDIAHAAADAETVSFDVEPSFCRVYSINTTNTTTNSSTDGRYSIGIVDRNQDEFLCLTSLTDDENYSSSTAFGGRNDGAGGVEYSIGSPDFTNHMQLDWTISATHANDGNTFFFCAVDLDGYWADVNSGTVPASTSTTIAVARDPEFAETMTNSFGSTPTYTGIMYFTALYYDKCKFNHGYDYKEVYGDSNSQDAKIEHMYCGFNVVNEFNQAYITKGLSDKVANGYFPGELLKFQLVAEKADLGTTTTLSASSYAGGQTWYGSNQFGIFSIEKLDDRPIITSVKSTGYYESTHTYPEHMLKNGNTATITGTGFSATQGTQKVYISDAVNLNDATTYEELAVTSWSATSITLTALALKTWMRHTSKGLHLCIVDGTAQTSKAYPVTCISELDDSHVSSHVLTYTGASAGAVRRDYQLIAESSLKDPYPKGFIILANRNLSNGLESNSSGNSGVDQTIVTLSVNQFLGIQRAVLSSISSSLISSTANETSYMSSDFIIDASGRNYTFRHCDPGSGSSRTSMEAIIRYKPGSGLYMDVLSDYSTSETIEFRILCFYGPSTIACAQFVTASSSRTTDIDIYRFGFRANSGLLHNIGGNYNLYSTSNARLAVGVFDKNANGAAYYQSYVSSSSQEGLITGSYTFIPYGSTTTGYYFTIDSIEDEYVDFNSANAFYGAASLGLWRGNLDSAAGLDTVAVNTGLSTDVPAGTAANKLLFYVFSDNTSTTYTEDFGPYSIGFAVKDEGEYSQGAMVDLDLSRLYSGNRDDACGIVPTSLTEYIYVQVDDFNYTGSTPRLNFQANTGSPSILNGRFYQWALEEGETYIVQDRVAELVFTTQDGTLQESGGGDTITQDAVAATEFTTGLGTLSVGVVNVVQDATVSVEFTTGLATFSLGTNTIVQDAVCSLEFTTGLGTLNSFMAQDATATLQFTTGLGTLDFTYYLAQDATCSLQFTTGDATISGAVNIIQDATCNLEYITGDAALILGSNTITQDAVCALQFTTNDATLVIGNSTISQDSIASLEFTTTDGSLIVGSVNAIQDATCSLQFTTGLGTLNLGSNAITQDATASVEFTTGDGSITSNSIVVQDATCALEFTTNDATLNLGTNNISQDATCALEFTTVDAALNLGSVNIFQDATCSLQFTTVDGNILSGGLTLVQDTTCSLEFNTGLGTLDSGSVNIIQDATCSLQFTTGDATLSLGSIGANQDATAALELTTSDGSLLLGNINIIQSNICSLEFTTNDGSVGGDITFIQDATCALEFTTNDATLILGSNTITQDATASVEFTTGLGTLSTGGLVFIQDATCSLQFTTNDATLNVGPVNIVQDATCIVQLSSNDATLILGSNTITQDATCNLQFVTNDASLIQGSVNIVQDETCLLQFTTGEGLFVLGSNTISQDASCEIEFTTQDGALTSLNTLVQDATCSLQFETGDGVFTVGAVTMLQDSSAIVAFTTNNAVLALGSILDFDIVYCEYEANNRFASYVNNDRKYFAKY